MRRALTSLTLLLLAPLAAAQDAPAEPYVRNVRQLTHDDVRAGEAYFSPDGKRILFQAVRQEHPYYQIYVMNVDGTGRKLVSTGKGKTTCAFFHPSDPDLFVYASSHLDERTHAPPQPGQQQRGYRWDYDGSMDIFVARVSTGEIVQRLTTADGYDAECAYSPDGRSICFTSQRDGSDSDIWLMDADGSNQRPVIQVKGIDGGPFFSPDGRSILFRASREREDVMQVYLTSLDGKQVRQLTDQARVNWAPFFHPDGQHVVYTANVGGHRNYDLFLVRADGSRREARLTTDEGFDGLPTFSPDGTKIMWTSTRHGGQPQVYIADFVMPPEDAFAVPAAPSADPHGQGGSNPHGGSANPHGGSANPHGGSANPHGGSSNPHGGSANPHGGSSNPHGGSANPHGDQGTNPHGNPHGANPHAAAEPLVRPAASGRTAPPGADRVRVDALMRDVAWLAADARDGRRAGTPGEREAAEWLARRFAELGVRPGGVDGAWLEPFTFPAGGSVKQDASRLTVDAHAWAYGDDWRPLLYSASGEVEGEVVLCGYGITSHDNDYFDLAGLDLKGKVALVLTGGPRRDKGGAFGKEHPSVFEDLMYKVANLRDAGAAAVLFVRPDTDDWLRLDMGDPGVLVGQVSRARARDLGVDLDATRRRIDASLEPQSRPLGRRARLQVTIERVRGRSQNVVGRITGTQRPDEVIVVGAHYDHLGRGGDGSLAAGSNEVHNGADDNASGTAGLLALAEALRAAPPRRTVLFVAFGAEESGLLGSQAFVQRLPVARERLVAMLNMDMIGRLGDGPLLVGGAGTAAEWPAIIQAAADATGATLRTQQDGLGPSDHATFYSAGLPVFFLWTGTHEDYHKPTDDAHKVDGAGTATAVKVALALVRGVDALERRPTFTKVARPDQPKRVVTGERGAYFGSIPNYAQDGLNGVLLDGAREGTPAGKAGIQKGDVVVEFAGHQVRTIQDYTNALRLSRPGQTVKVVVMRDGQRVELTATLEGR